MSCAVPLPAIVQMDPGSHFPPLQQDSSSPPIKSPLSTSQVQLFLHSHPSFPSLLNYSRGRTFSKQHVVLSMQIQPLLTAFTPNYDAFGHGIPAWMRNKPICINRSTICSYQPSENLCLQHKEAAFAFTYQVFAQFQVSEKHILCLISSAAALTPAPHHIH